MNESEYQEKLMAEYRNHQQERPRPELDDFIRHQARVALTQDTKPVLSFWQRWRLPVSVFASLGLTLVVAQQLLPLFKPPVNSQPAPAETVNIEFLPTQTLPIQTPLRDRIELPDSVNAPQPPAIQRSRSTPQPTLSDSELFTPPNLDVPVPAVEIPKIPSVIASRDELTPNDSADRWAARILLLVKEKRFAEARNELKRFKEAHPDYSIEERLQPIWQ